jgi:hypothetical protein
MILNENELEFIFAVYDSAKSLVSEKDKLVLAEELIRHMISHGMELKTFAQEVGEHDRYLDEAVSLFLEQSDESEDDEYWLADEDEWE